MIDDKLSILRKALSVLRTNKHEIRHICHALVYGYCVHNNIDIDKYLDYFYYFSGNKCMDEIGFDSYDMFPELLEYTNDPYEVCVERHSAWHTIVLDGVEYSKITVEQWNDWNNLKVEVLKQILERYEIQKNEGLFR